MLNRNNLLRSDQSLYKRYVGNKDRTTLVDKEQYFTNLAEKFYRANLNPDTWCISYYLKNQRISHEKAVLGHS